MTLDEAIRYEEKKIEEYDKIKDIKAITLNMFQDVCVLRQVVEWLKELKQLREKEESKDELKYLSKRVEALEKQMKEDREEQLKKPQADLDYAKFCYDLLPIQFSV